MSHAMHQFNRVGDPCRITNLYLRPKWRSRHASTRRRRSLNTWTPCPSPTSPCPQSLACNDSILQISFNDIKRQLDFIKCVKIYLLETTTSKHLWWFHVCVVQMDWNSKLWILFAIILNTKIELSLFVFCNELHSRLYWLLKPIKVLHERSTVWNLSGN